MWWTSDVWLSTLNPGKMVKTLDHHYIRKLCSDSGTERSGAAQRCRPSATGSASAAPSVEKPSCGMNAPEVAMPSNMVKEDEPGADSSPVQLPVSDSESVKCQMHDLERGICGEPATHEVRNPSTGKWDTFCERDAKMSERNGFEIRKLSDAPQRSGGERRKLNVRISSAEIKK